MNYWAKRQALAHTHLADKTALQLQRRLRSYYKASANKVIDDFLSLYQEVLNSAITGQVSANDLYKLDRYFHLQRNLKSILRDLGEKEVAQIGKHLESLYSNIFNSISLPGVHKESYSFLTEFKAKMVANEIWVADSLSWSERVWRSMNELQYTLERGLIDATVRGASTDELKRELMARFNVSYNEANRLVRTELAHVQTQASADRYKEAGITHYEILVEEDAHTCEDCAPATYTLEEMETGVNAPPFHPNCRCAIVPVI